MRAPILTLVLTLPLLSLGCDDEPDAPASPAEGAAPTPAEGPEAEAQEEPAAAPDPDEACAQVVVVAWAGAAHASEEITRTREEARTKAEDLRRQLEEGTEFAELARVESDASSSGPRGGLLGTYRREEWPGAHEAIRDTVFGLSVAQLSEVVEAPYGYVVARRCAVEKVHTRHILIRYAGARNAGEEVTRTEEAARALADEIHNAVGQDGADFAQIARQRSEDSSAERGGDLGEVGRGRLAPEYEAAAFSLAPGEISVVVQTEFGFHVIQRVE